MVLHLAEQLLQRHFVILLRGVFGIDAWPGSPAISIASPLPCVTTLFRNSRTMMAASGIGRRMRCVLILRRDPTSACRTASNTTADDPGLRESGHSLTPQVAPVTSSSPLTAGLRASARRSGSGGPRVEIGMSPNGPLFPPTSYRKSTRRLTRGVRVRLTVGNDRRPDGRGSHQNRIFAKIGSPGRGAAVSATRDRGLA